MVLLALSRFCNDFGGNREMLLNTYYFLEVFLAFEETS